MPSSVHYVNTCNTLPAFVSSSDVRAQVTCEMTILAWSAPSRTLTSQLAVQCSTRCARQKASLRRVARLARARSDQRISLRSRQYLFGELRANLEPADCTASSTVGAARLRLSCAGVSALRLFHSCGARVAT